MKMAAIVATATLIAAAPTTTLAANLEIRFAGTDLKNVAYEIQPVAVSISSGQTYSEIPASDITYSSISGGTQATVNGSALYGPGGSEISAPLQIDFLENGSIEIGIKGTSDLFLYAATQETARPLSLLDLATEGVDVYSGSFQLVSRTDGSVETITTSAPEPGVWALLLGGVGAMGLMLRRRRRAGATVTA